VGFILKINNPSAVECRAIGKKQAASRVCAPGREREGRSGESNNFQPSDLPKREMIKGGYQYKHRNQRLKVTVLVWREVKVGLKFKF
jgi:hypothetical protein